MMDLEKSIEKVEVELAALRQACLGKQKALDDATFDLTMAAHGVGLLPHANSHYDPDAWAAVIPLAVEALRMRDRGADGFVIDLLKDCAIKCGYSVCGVHWLTKRAVDLAMRKDGDPVVRVFHVRAGDHVAPQRVKEVMCADLCRQFEEAEMKSPNP